MGTFRQNLGVLNEVDTLKDDEGFEQYPYKDSLGVLTIGYGFNLEARGLPQRYAECILKDIVTENHRILEQEYPIYRRLDPPRQGVLLNIAYNVGIKGIKQFKRMWKALEKGNFSKAADEILDSKAARQHEDWGNPRYKRLAKRMVLNVY